MKRSVILLLLIFTSGCSGLLFPHRTFVDEMEQESEGFFVPGRDFESIPGDSGNPYRSDSEIALRTPASARGAKALLREGSLRKELANKERGLTPYEYQLYAEQMSELETDSEKIYYLNLSRRERTEYSRILQIGSSRRPIGQRVVDPYQSSKQSFLNTHFLTSKEVLMGMNKDSVQDNWGRPVRVDVAGDPKNENERWAFVENGKLKYIYFEKGRVQGWAYD